MANECSKLNPECMMKNNIPCPAYDAGKNCWEYDWLPMFQSLPLQERELARATEQREQRRGLLERGIISRKEAEETEVAVATAQWKVEDTQRAIVGVDQAMAEATTVLPSPAPVGVTAVTRT